MGIGEGWGWFLCGAWVPRTDTVRYCTLRGAGVEHENVFTAGCVSGVAGW